MDFDMFGPHHTKTEGKRLVQITLKVDIGGITKSTAKTKCFELFIDRRKYWHIDNFSELHTALDFLEVINHC